MIYKTPQYTPAIDAAKTLGVSTRTVISWVRSGRVIGTKLPNNRYVVLASEIDRLTRPLSIEGTVSDLDVRGDR
jgi:predicted site-specific integrase-resolvase